MGILLLAAARGHDARDRRRRPGRGPGRGRARPPDRVRPRRGTMQRLKGIAVTGGVAVGRAVLLVHRGEAVRFPIPPDRVGGRSRAARGRLASGRALSSSTSRRASAVDPVPTSRRSSTRSC